MKIWLSKRTFIDKKKSKKFTQVAINSMKNNVSNSIVSLR